MKYKVGDKVRIKSLDWYNENKNDFGKVWTSDGQRAFYKCMSKWCGKVMTVSYIGVNYYNMVEDWEESWTDEMIEGLTEETKPKFKVGDIIAKPHFGLRIIKVESDRYIVEGTPGINVEVFFKDQDKYRLMEEGTKPLTFGDSWECPQGYQFVDEKGNVINAQKIILEKKKPEYPETYAACWFILKYYTNNDIVKGYESELLENFQKLLICRDAYWKIAGEEMGLGKPWKPDWKNPNQKKYCIRNDSGDIKKVSLFLTNAILAFPTEEMRDAFFENFKELIESVKKLL